MGFMFLSFMRIEIEKLEKERRSWKINLRLRDMIVVKKIRIVCFVHEVITNRVIL